mmetsp:Transcript_36711/g.114971  ORF Transcript_36711/g.114971 Transcript_36711/m.114971 type:complete len:299 (+) Transcript_36711:2200-3096(+)
MASTTRRCSTSTSRASRRSTERRSRTPTFGRHTSAAMPASSRAATSAWIAWNRPSHCATPTYPAPRALRGRMTFLPTRTTKRSSSTRSLLRGPRTKVACSPSGSTPRGASWAARSRARRRVHPWSATRRRCARRSSRAAARRSPASGMARMRKPPRRRRQRRGRSTSTPRALRWRSAGCAARATRLRCASPRAPRSCARSSATSSAACRKRTTGSSARSFAWTVLISKTVARRSGTSGEPSRRTLSSGSASSRQITRSSRAAARSSSRRSDRTSKRPWPRRIPRQRSRWSCARASSRE